MQFMTYEPKRQPYNFPNFANYPICFLLLECGFRWRPGN